MPLEIIDQGLARLCPLKRCGVPADIAKAVALLVSPESEWINGTCTPSGVRIIKLTFLFRSSYSSQWWWCLDAEAEIGG
jgi:hypothetical protein